MLKIIICCGITCEICCEKKLFAEVSAEKCAKLLAAFVAKKCAQSLAEFVAKIFLRKYLWNFLQNVICGYFADIIVCDFFLQNFLRKFICENICRNFICEIFYGILSAKNSANKSAKKCCCGHFSAKKI